MDLRTAALIHRESRKPPKQRVIAHVVGYRNGRHVIEVGGKTVLAKSMQIAAAGYGDRVDLVGDFFDH